MVVEVDLPATALPLDMGALPLLEEDEAICFPLPKEEEEEDDDEEEATGSDDALAAASFSACSCRCCFLSAEAMIKASNSTKHSRSCVDCESFTAAVASFSSRRKASTSHRHASSSSE